MKRTEAREQAFILVFEKSFQQGEELSEILESARFARELSHNEFMEMLAAGVYKHLDDIDPIIERNCIGWKKARISKVALAVLRLCCYELMYMHDIPSRVSINEAVELAKKYAGEEDAAYVNGVLGAVAKQVGDPS